MQTVIDWIKTIGWALLCLFALIIVVPISFVVVGILSRNDDMHIPDPETDEEVELMEYLNNHGHEGYHKS